MDEKDQLKILIVDDDEEDYMIIRELFSEIKGKKYSLDWVADYDVALETIGRNNYDVYLFDYRLGKHTGLDLLRKTISSGCKAPIILLTGKGDHDIDLQAMKMGAADYLVKGEMNALFLERSIRYALEHKKMENKLRVMLQDLQKAHEEFEKAESIAKAKSNFLANMSHEIRTPMNSILGFGEILRRTPLSDKQKNCLDAIQSDGQLLIGIIDDILNITRLELGKIKLETIDFNLESLIYSVFKMVVARMKDKPCDTYVDIDANVPIEVKGDPTRLRQILVNLLGNAIKFTSRGSIGVIVQLKSKEEPTDSGNVELLFKIKDTGIGIPSDKADAIFKMFTQADESTTRKYGGTGLGLAISKSIVKMMGGQIWVESEEGKGSEFVFTLKLKKSEPIDQNGNVRINIKDIRGKKVFIVDDNEIVRKIINKYCERMDLKIVGIADSPQSALQKIENLITKRNCIPDLILCDLIMEGMDGFELVKNIRKHQEFKDVKYIAVTADLLAETSENASGEVFDAYVTKPVSLIETIHVIKKVMNIKDEKKEIEKELASCEGIKILVVDDSLRNQVLMQAYFDELKCEGDFAKNGQEAIDKLKTNKYHLCLMDLHMPVLGGVEATKIIRKEFRKNIPIIALTAAVLEEDRKNAKDAGMNDFLTKPIDLVEMAEKINQYGKNGRI